MPKGVYVRTEKMKKNIRLAKQNISIETRRKISTASTGTTKNLSASVIEKKRVLIIARNKLSMSDKTRKKMSDAKKGIAPPKEVSIKGALAVKKAWSDPEYRKLHDRYGNKNANWKGGTSFEPYCVKFNPEFRERVRKFFNHTCQVCGHKWVIGEKRLAVHHINYDKTSCCNNKIPLFVPTCVGGCHNKTNSHRQFWEDWFTEIINEFYNGKCYYSKEEMQNINTMNE